MIVDRVIKKADKLMLALKARQEVDQLRRDGTGDARLLERALRATLRNSPPPEEKALIAKIEQLRKTVSASTEEIDVVDFGSGSADLDVSAEQMQQGRTLKRQVGQICRSDSKRYISSFFLFNLIRSFKPLSCVELGTSLGISASYQAAALKLNQAGQIVTLEGSPSLAARAEQHFKALGLDTASVVVGPFDATLNDVLERHQPIDYAFIDGHHDEHATLAYFEQIAPFLSRRAVLVFDDINWSEGMRRAWHTLEADQRISLAADLHNFGVCVLDQSAAQRQRFAMQNVFRAMKGLRFA